MGIRGITGRSSARKAGYLMPDEVEQPDQIEESTDGATHTTEDVASGKADKKRGRRKNPQAGKKLTEKEKTTRDLKRLIRKILIVAACITVLLTVVGGFTIWHDNNMFPNVKDGDLLITLKLGGSYNGDIVLYEISGETRIGRVVGIPGDTVDFNDDGTYTINGTVPYETIYFATKPAQGSQIEYPYTVKEGEVFVLNDMRDMDSDSRVYGGIAETKGKVVLIIRRRGF